LLIRHGDREQHTLIDGAQHGVAGAHEQHPQRGGAKVGQVGVLEEVFLE